MELYNLKLQKPISYQRLEGTSAGALLSLAGECEEGSEFLARWAKDALIHETEDGPLVVQPLPAPLWAGRLAKESQSAETAALEAGPYLFCQSRASTEEDIKDVLEWFVRECWWTRAAAGAEIILRLVREDGKTAVQALTRDIELDS